MKHAVSLDCISSYCSPGRPRPTVLLLGACSPDRRRKRSLPAPSANSRANPCASSPQTQLSICCIKRTCPDERRTSPGVSSSGRVPQPPAGEINAALHRAAGRASLLRAKRSSSWSPTSVPLRLFGPWCLARSAMTYRAGRPAPAPSDRHLCAHHHRGDRAVGLRDISVTTGPEAECATLFDLEDPDLGQSGGSGQRPGRQR